MLKHDRSQWTTSGFTLDCLAIAPDLVSWFCYHHLNNSGGGDNLGIFNTFINNENALDAHILCQL